MSKKKKWSLEQFKEEVRHLDPAVNENETIFKTALFILVTLQVGRDINKLKAFTGLPKYFLKPRIARLVRNNIWQKDYTVSNWFKKKGGGIAFWMDVCVAEGFMKISRNEVKK